MTDPAADHGRRPRAGTVVSVILLIAAIGVLTATVLATAARSDAIAQAGRVDRSHYTPAPTLTSAASNVPVVSLISDELSTTAELAWPDPEWPVQIARRLKVTMYSLSSAGSGYAVQPASYEFGGTFAAKASQVSPQSRVVVFFGGGNDTKAKLSEVRASATEAVETARRTAPKATVVIVGPASTSEQPSDKVLAIRDALKEVASASKARWVDPISAGWLSSVKGVVGADGQSLTKTGEATLTDRFEAVLKPLVD